MTVRNESDARVIHRRIRGEDQDFIYAALGGLTLCVAALYMAVALPRIAPLIVPRLVDMRVQTAITPVAWVPAQDLAEARAPAKTSLDDGLEKPAQVMTIGSAAKLADLFADMNYNLDAARSDHIQVPRVFLASLPSDFQSMPSTDTRKELFIRTMLPLVLKVNESILLERGRLLALRAHAEAGRAPTAEEAAWLSELAQRYGLDKPDFDQLLTRVDIIPPSLAVAQAAEESGWGTSRFARQGNAAFGQYTFSEDDGLMPDRRDDGKHHFIHAYDHLLDAVRSYALNLNTHDAYRQFRKQRAEMRARGQEVDGNKLVSSITAYSERGGDYIESIQSLMKANNLDPLDHAKLEGGKVVDMLAAGK